MVFLYILISVLIVSFISLVGIFALTLKETILKRILLVLVSFSTGALIGDAFLHLIPEIASKGSITSFDALFLLMGILAFFALEKILRWRHCHDIDCMEHPKHLGTMNLFGDAFHNFLDGALIGASYLVSLPLGLSTTLAVILHEIPQELGDFGVLIHSGFSRERAIFYNFLSAAMAVLGAMIAFAIGNSAESFTKLAVPFTAGGFIYIALSGLVPELHKEEDWQKSIVQLLTMIAGIGVMYLLLFL